MIKKLITGIAAIAVSTSTAFADDLANKSWDEIVAQAKEEGQVVFSNWFLRDELKNAMKPFEEKYGITVVIPDGQEASFKAKVLAEKDAEKGDIDVFAQGFEIFEEFEPSSLFMKLDALPKDDGRVSELLGINSDGHGYAYWGNQTGIAYDPAKVDESKLPQTPEDFAAFWAANPGKFGFNYIKGGSGISFYHNMIRTISGDDLTDGTDSPERLKKIQPAFDFFNKHAENYVITASNGDSITRVSDGELWMVPGWEDHVAGLQKRGEIRKDIKFYVPSMGMNGGGNGVMVPKNAPHKAAALVFINWLTSPETQTAFNNNFGTAPMNTKADAKNALVPAEQRQYRKPWPSRPFRDKVEEAFIENVIQER